MYFQTEILIQKCVHATAEGFDYIVDGFDKLPKSFLPQLKDKIIFKAKVSKVQQSKKGVTVHISCSGIDCTDDTSGKDALKLTGLVMCACMSPPCQVYNTVFTVINLII